MCTCCGHYYSWAEKFTDWSLTSLGNEFQCRHIVTLSTGQIIKTVSFWDDMRAPTQTKPRRMIKRGKQNNSRRVMSSDVCHFCATRLPPLIVQSFLLIFLTIRLFCTPCPLCHFCPHILLISLWEWHIVLTSRKREAGIKERINEISEQKKKQYRARGSSCRAQNNKRVCEPFDLWPLWAQTIFCPSPHTNEPQSLTHMNGPLYVYNIYTDFDERLGKRNILILCDFVNLCLGVLT